VRGSPAEENAEGHRDWNEKHSQTKTENKERGKVEKLANGKKREETVA